LLADVLKEEGMRKKWRIKERASGRENRRLNNGITRREGRM